MYRDREEGEKEVSVQDTAWLVLGGWMGSMKLKWLFVEGWQSQGN